jgi:hypothetical protein
MTLPNNPSSINKYTASILLEFNVEQISIPIPSMREYTSSVLAEFSIENGNMSGVYDLVVDADFNEDD